MYTIPPGNRFLGKSERVTTGKYNIRLTHTKTGDRNDLTPDSKLPPSIIHKPIQVVAETIAKCIKLISNIFVNLFVTGCRLF